MRVLAGHARAATGRILVGHASRGGPFTLDFTTGVLPPGLTFTRAGGGGRINSSGLYEWFGADVPRFDHNPATGALRGLLIEESRTNLALWSEAFSNASWVKAGATISADVATAPDGTVTADKLVESAATETHQVLIAGFNYLAATTYTQSIFLKAAGRSKVRYSMAPAAFYSIEPFAIFDLDTGTVESSAQCQAQIFSVGNGWYRISMSATTDADGGATLGVSTLRLWTSSATYAGDGTSGVFIWGAQVEVGTFPTSYIPTTTAAATRAADQPRITANLGTRDVRVTTEAGVQVLTAQALTGSYWPALTGPQHIRKIEVL